MTRRTILVFVTARIVFVVFVAWIVTCSTAGPRILIPAARFMTLAVVTWCVTGVTVAQRLLSPALPLFLDSGRIRVRFTVAIGIAAFTVIAAAVVIQVVCRVATKCLLSHFYFMTQTVFCPAKKVAVSVFLCAVALWTALCRVVTEAVVQKCPGLVAVELKRLFGVLHT